MNKADVEPETFHQHKDFLEENIDPDYGLLDKLQSSNALSAKKIRLIKYQATFDQRNTMLLEYVTKQNKCNLLINALKEAKQEHIVNYLIGKGEYRLDFGEEWPLTEAELKILDTNQETLIDLIDPSGLVGLLYSRKVINKRQRDAINSKPTCHEKNEFLLEILRRRSLKDFKVTIECLCQSNQSHVAEVLEKGGAVIRVHVQGLDDTTEDEVIDSFTNVLRNRPIEESVRILEGTLIALKKGKSVVLYIYCRTIEQLMQLKEEQTNGKFKEFVQRLFAKLLIPTQNMEVTVQNLQKFVESIFTGLFHRSKIDEIVVTLPKKEYHRCRACFPENIKIRAVHDFSPIDMNSPQRDEPMHVIQLKESNFKEQKDEFDSNKLNLEVEQQASETENSENTLKGLWNNYDVPIGFKKGDVMEVIPPINIGDTITWWKAIHLESRKIGYVPRILVIIDYQVQEYETSVATSQTDYSKPATSKASISNLPLELLDSILRKSYLQGVLREEQVLKNKDYDAISHMASVDCCWLQRIRRRKFKKELRRSLIVFYRRKEKISSIYRSNRQYLEENIQLQGLANQLKSNDLLTDVQTASLYRQSYPFGKDSFEKFREIISKVVKKIEATNSAFTRCLCDTKQHLLAESIENGGAMTKVEINFRKAKTSVETRRLNLQIAEGINETRGKTKARSHQIEELMGKLKQDDLEILSAAQDGVVVVVWIWCKTKYALEKLQTLNKSNDLIDIFTELVKNLSFSSEERNPAMLKPKVNIDFEQFKKTVVFFSFVANCTSRLNFRIRTEEEDVRGVTKLRNKIYVLLRRYSAPNCAILVFEDCIPFRFQKRLEIKEIESTTDIVSIEMENSLYILDVFDGCIWKIKEVNEKEKEEKLIRWLHLQDHSVRPETLSVTRDGQLLIVDWRGDDLVSTLMIFGVGRSAEADLRLSIQLPKDIQNPRHAVETYKGNFIILHEIKSNKKEESESAGKNLRTIFKIQKDDETGIGHLIVDREEEAEKTIWVISEVSRDGKTMLRRFLPKNKEQELFLASSHLVVDSLDRVLLADSWHDRVILFDSSLQWNGILIPSKEDGENGRRIWRPGSLFHDEEKNELIVGGHSEVFVYNLNRK